MQYYFRYKGRDGSMKDGTDSGQAILKAVRPTPDIPEKSPGENTAPELSPLKV